MRTCVLGLALICGWLTPPSVEAGLLDWLYGNKQQYGSGGNTVAGNVFAPVITNAGGSNLLNDLIISNGQTGSGTMQQMNNGPTYVVSIEQQRSETGECEEKIKISLTNTEQEKNFVGKCSKYGQVKAIKNDGDFLLVGNPEENFCAFSVNNNELYYLLDGKWRKGEFNSDNTNDKELTSSEVDSIKERIKKWQAFFEESEKEVEKIRSLRNVVRGNYYNERNRLKVELRKEQLLSQQTQKNVRQMQTQERKRHYAEVRNIQRKRDKGELTSDEADQLFDAEDVKNETNMYDLDRKQQDEEERLQKKYDDFDRKIDVASNEMDEEMNKLDQLENGEENRVRSQIKENISQGW